MTDQTLSTSVQADAAPGKSLLARVVGVFVSPRATYADVAARPRWFGVLALGIALVAGSTFAFLSTEVGQQAVLEQQAQVLESFGVKLSEAQQAQMESRLESARYTSAVSQVVFIPLAAAILAGILLGIFNALMGGDARFKQVYALVAHTGLIVALQTIFSLPLDYVRETMSSPTNLGVFAPFLEENTFPARLLGSHRPVPHLGDLVPGHRAGRALQAAHGARSPGPCSSCTSSLSSPSPPSGPPFRSNWEYRCPRRTFSSPSAVVLVAAAVVGANLYFIRDSGLTVTTEQIKARDLEAIVSASGKIQPKRLVNITAETAGRVVNLAVNEGDRVHAGQFLLQIDPKSLRTRVDSGEASLQVAQASLEQMRQSVETARVQLDQAQAEPRPPAGPVETAADDAGIAGEGGERRQDRRVRPAGAREERQRPGQPHHAGARDAR